LNRSSSARLRKLRQVQNRHWRFGLTLGAFAVFCLPGLHGERLEALPSSVVKAVQQGENLAPAAVQPQQFQAPVSGPEAAARRMLDARLRGLGESFNGDVGIAVRDVQTGYVSHFDGAGHFPQQSVSKFWVTLTALDKADRGELSLTSPVTLRKDDLTLFNQPIAALVKAASGYTTTLLDLVQRAMQHSDNTANDFTLWRSGGPEAVRDFLNRKGISGVRFGPGERVMQSRIAGMEWKPWYVGSAFYAARNAVPAHVRRAAFQSYVADPVDGATPIGITDALARLKRGQLLSPASTDRLLRIMSNTRTGPQRLKGGLAPGWSLAHKTGTGQVLGATQSGYNDIGIISGPDGRSYAVAVMIRTTAAPIPTRMALMQNVTRAVIDYGRSFGGYSVAQSYGAGPRPGAGSN
jgi:beta-lactamase class A